MKNLWLLLKLFTGEQKNDEVHKNGLKRILRVVTIKSVGKKYWHGQIKIIDYLAKKIEKKFLGKN